MLYWRFPFERPLSSAKSKPKEILAANASIDVEQLLSQISVLSMFQEGSLTLRLGLTLAPKFPNELYSSDSVKLKVHKLFLYSQRSVTGNLLMCKIWGSCTADVQPVARISFSCTDKRIRQFRFD